MNARATLMIAGTGAGRAMLLVAYAGFAVLAAILATAPMPQGATMVLYMLALPTVFLWAGWFARLLLLQREAMMARLPGVGRSVLGALALAAAASILLPAALVAWLGTAPAIAVGGLACAAASGLLFMMLPRALAPLIGFLPMFMRASGLGHLFATIDPAMLVPGLAAASGLLSALLWTRLARIETVSSGAWTQPFLFLAGERGSFWNTRMPDDTAGARPRWLQPRVRDGSGPSRPVAAMRTLLGAPFAPVGPKQLAMNILLSIVGAALVWRWLQSYGYRNPGEALSQAQALVLAGGGAGIVASYAMRLQQLRARASGTMAELALLPGWGGGAGARRTLLAAIGRPLGVASAALLAIVLALALAAHDGPALTATLLLGVAGITLSGAALCLRTLRGRELEAGSKWALILAGVLLYALTSAALDRGGAWLAVAGGAWLALCAGAMAAALPAWRELHGWPHPFLLE
ncbi:MAG TPA: hypothetical protein VFT52_02000 [Luteimonas sp.]|nr:hypothetical protein [Luteimonas sp.]